MTGLWRLVPAPYRLLALAVLAAAALASLWAWGHAREARGDRAGRAAVQAMWDAAELRRAAVAAAAQLAARAEEQRRAAAHQEALDAYEAQLARARADAAIADAAAGRLRQRVAALIRAARGDSGGADPGVAPPGPAAQDPAGLLADVLGRCVERVRFLAAAADERGAAGQACERAYDALTPAP